MVKVYRMSVCGCLGEVRLFCGTCGAAKGLVQGGAEWCERGQAVPHAGMLVLGAAVYAELREVLLRCVSDKARVFDVAEVVKRYTG
jgi:hypothetical protein